MKAKFLKTILLCAALALPVACDRTPEKPAAKGAKIGAIIPLTGEVATYGEALKRGFELAREHSDGQISIIYEDSKADPKTGVTAFQKLTSRDNVEAILGDATSGVCLAIAPLAEQNHKVLLITIATSDKLAEAGEYVFRTAPPNKVQADTAANFLVNDLKAKKIAILAKDNPYASNLADVFREKLKGTDAAIVMDERYAESTQDFASLISKLASVSPDAVFVPGNYEEVAQILRRAKELGITAPFLGTDGAYSPKVAELAGDAAEGFMITMLSVDRDSPMYKEFAAAYQARFNEEPDVFAAYGYEGLRILQQALDAGVTSGIALQPMLQEREFQSMTGDVNFNEDGGLPRAYGIYEIREGSFLPKSP